MQPDPAFRKQVLLQLAGLNSHYRAQFIEGQVMLPLSVVPFATDGLLKQLPPIGPKKGWPWDVETDASLFNHQQQWPRLSIVIPSYNQGEFLEEAIRSVLLQNYPNLELIVIDGGSTDNSKTILAQYGHWISYYQSQKDGGQGQAINLGFALAGGNYLGWLNSDDFYNKNALFTLATAIRKTAKDFYYGDAYAVDKDQSEKHYCKAALVKDVFLRFGGIIYSHSAFWKKEIHQPVWETMNCNVDGELWIRLVKGRSKAHVKFPIGTLRFYEDTKSASEKWKIKWKQDDRNIDKLHGPPPEPDSIIAYLHRLVQRIFKKFNNSALNEVR